MCGLCHGFVQFLLPRSRDLRFAPLQGPTAAALLARFGRDPADLDTVYLLTGLSTPHPQLRDRSGAALAALVGLGGPWRALAPLGWLPRWLRDGIYTVVARSRYRLVRRLDACPLPAPADRKRFLP